MGCVVVPVRVQCRVCVSWVWMMPVGACVCEFVRGHVSVLCVGTCALHATSGVHVFVGLYNVRARARVWQCVCAQLLLFGSHVCCV